LPVEVIPAERPGPAEIACTRCRTRATFTYDKTTGSNNGIGHLTTVTDESGNTHWTTMASAA
jgi:hypothetical protein